MKMNWNAINIVRIYRCGGTFGIVYTNGTYNKDGNLNRFSTLVGSWDEAPSCVFDMWLNMKSRGVTRLRMEDYVAKLLTESDIRKAAQNAPAHLVAKEGERRATPRQVEYAHDLATALAYNQPWNTTLGRHWFKTPPTKAMIAAMSLRQCSRLIDQLKMGY